MAFNNRQHDKGSPFRCFLRVTVVSSFLALLSGKLVSVRRGRLRAPDIGAYRKWGQVRVFLHVHRNIVVLCYP